MLPCQQPFLLFPLISVVVRLIQILFGLHLPVITELVATATATTKACEGSKLKGFLKKYKTKKRQRNSLFSVSLLAGF